MSVIQLTVSCTVSMVQLTVQCCIQTVCCGFQFALYFVTFNCCYSMSVIQFTVSCPCSYSLNYLVYRSFARDVERPSDSKLSVTDRFKPSAYSTTNTNSSSCSSRKYCDKKYRSNSLNSMSQQRKFQSARNTEFSEFR
jgi:hypothetical protein